MNLRFTNLITFWARIQTDRRTDITSSEVLLLFGPLHSPTSPNCSHCFSISPFSTEIFYLFRSEIWSNSDGAGFPQFNQK